MRKNKKINEELDLAISNCMRNSGEFIMIVYLWYVTNSSWWIFGGIIAALVIFEGLIKLGISFLENK